ncbi:hypothetical protein L9F63_026784, partial [Diploptera punctata]
MKDFDFEDKSVDGLANSNSASGVCPSTVGTSLKAEDENKDLLHSQQQQHQQPPHQNLMDVVGNPQQSNRRSSEQRWSTASSVSSAGASTRSTRRSRCKSTSKASKY